MKRPKIKRAAPPKSDNEVLGDKVCEALKGLAKFSSEGYQKVIAVVIVVVIILLHVVFVEVVLIVVDVGRW